MNELNQAAAAVADDTNDNVLRTLARANRLLRSYDVIGGGMPIFFGRAWEATCPYGDRGTSPSPDDVGAHGGTILYIPSVWKDWPDLNIRCTCPTCTFDGVAFANWADAEFRAAETLHAAVARGTPPAKARKVALRHYKALRKEGRARAALGLLPVYPIWEQAA